MTDGNDLTEAARLLDIRPPEDEFRALAEARMETLAKLGRAAGPTAGAPGSSASRLDIYPDAIFRGLAYIREARPR